MAHWQWHCELISRKYDSEISSSGGPGQGLARAARRSRDSSRPATCVCWWRQWTAAVEVPLWPAAEVLRWLPRPLRGTSHAPPAGGAKQRPLPVADPPALSLGLRSLGALIRMSTLECGQAATCGQLRRTLPGGNLGDTSAASHQEVPSANPPARAGFRVPLTAGELEVQCDPAIIRLANWCTRADS